MTYEWMVSYNYISHSTLFKYFMLKNVPLNYFYGTFVIFAFVLGSDLVVV